MNEEVIYKIGDKYERISPIGPGEGSGGRKFNSFKITNETTRHYTISGKLVSGITDSRKVQKQDFHNFIKSYKNCRG